LAGFLGLNLPACVGGTIFCVLLLLEMAPVIAIAIDNQNSDIG
jgi:hypothetical protein